MTALLARFTTRTDQRVAWPCAPCTLLVAVTLGACSTASLEQTLPKITAGLPTLTNLPGEPGRIDAGPQTVYERVASGATKCWFASNGQLKKSYIFHAEAEPPSQGGAAEISVMERDTSGAKPWGPRTFKVQLAASGEQTVIAVENLKMPEATAQSMRADVFQWALGGSECKLAPVEIATPPVPAATLKAAKQKPKVKTATRPALPK